MPTILRIGAFRFYFFSHEPNEPPHVHIDRDDQGLAGSHGGCQKSRGFRAHEIGSIVGMVSDNRERLLEAWHEHFG